VTVWIVRAPNGDELAVLPLAEYEALLNGRAVNPEDIADTARFDRRKACVSDARQKLPPEVSAYILDGESRLKAVRKWRGLSQVALCTAGGIRQSYLSELESGHKVGTTATIASLAAALGVPPAWIR
jgi:ribosome-binding protein aMBF1 (putative translation factor)